MGREDALEDAIAEARKELWQANYVRKNDSQHQGESEEHWQARKKRNRHRFNHREDVVKHLANKLEALRAHKEAEQEPTGTDAIGFATFEGKTVAAWMIPWLEKSRAAGWSGYVTSGVRTPAYSISLCEAMCGAPSCPGRCAGATSNHNMLPSQGYPYGAIDVSDYGNFEAIQSRIGSPLRNDLPIDPVHFSVSGH
jgi:hypothetical protein